MALSRVNQAPLRIIHLNDLHEHNTAMPSVISGIQTLRGQAEAAGADVLVLNAGDTNVGGQPQDWVLSVDLLNRAGVQASTIGNHELDGGATMLAQGMAGSRFPLLISNVIAPASATGAWQTMLNTKKLQQEPVVLTGKSGQRYGILGITTPDMNALMSETRREGAEFLDWQGTFQRVNDQVSRLRQQGVNQVIVLSHMGYETDRELAQVVPGIDVIVGGHSHTKLGEVSPGENLLKGPTGEPVLLVQTGQNAKRIGVADVTFSTDGRLNQASITLQETDQLPPDEAAAQRIAQNLGPAKPLAFLLTPYSDKQKKYAENPLANFVGDAMRTMAQVDVAFVRSADLKSWLPTGIITQHHVKQLFPYNDAWVVSQVPGQALLDAVSRVSEDIIDPATHLPMPYPAGMSLVYHQDTGALLSAQINGQPIDPQKTYRVAMPNYMVTHAKEFPSLAQPNWVIERPEGLTLDAAFTQALHVQGAPQRAVAFYTDGRVAFLE